jgi:potassium efflux system protein
VLSTLLAQQDVSVEVLATQHLVFGLLVSLVLTGLLASRVWIASNQAAGLTATQRRLRFGLMFLIAAIPLSAILGYVALSRLLATHWVLTAGLLALLALLWRVGQELVTQMISADSTPGRYLRQQLTLTDEGAEMLGFWGIVTLKTAIGIAGAMALLLLWSLDRKDVLLWIEDTFYGFKLGGIHISPAGILLGLLLFTVLLTATRLVQRTLDRRIFPRTRLDSGLRHSIRSSVGYAGFALAAILGISTMGIDLSSLALIAGALSVGIGFGLQNIVNNFVSGLILLVERPIKAGDWVVVGEHQGYVRQISVRATEITTFDRASVFIPNSSLISGAVMNRTYADKIGRVVLPIGIAYDSDPVEAREVLLEIAGGNPDIRVNPAPAVLMRGFGDNALNLELIAFVHDVDKVRAVTSDLCFAIHAAFSQHGIRIPYPQRELRLTLDDEQLRRVLGGREPPPKPKPAASAEAQPKRNIPV